MEPELIIMAAGMGSRYGGLKQLDKIGPNGEIILELSVYAAMKAGFKRVSFIIREEIEKEFRELIGNKISENMEVNYIYQAMEFLPKGFSIDEARVKPLGTAHALYCAKDTVQAPFAVINADDYYGTEAFKLIFDFLKENTIDNNHAMVGYKLKNTLSENGHVARGICTVENNLLVDVVERTKIIKGENTALYTEDDNSWEKLSLDAIVSMNMWGFMPSIFQNIEVDFKSFLSKELVDNPLKAEFYIPKVVNNLLMNKKAQVKVMLSTEKWYGVTYKEDKENVRSAIAKLVNKGVYPKNLWEEN